MSPGDTRRWREKEAGNRQEDAKLYHNRLRQRLQQGRRFEEAMNGHREKPEPEIGWQQRWQDATKP